MGGLRPEISIADAVDVFWFYFGSESFFTLVDGNGWSHERAESWLAEQACRVLLASPASPEN